MKHEAYFKQSLQKCSVLYLQRNAAISNKDEARGRDPSR